MGCVECKNKSGTSNNDDICNHLTVGKYVNVPGKNDIKELQKTTILGIAHIVWELLMSNYKTFIMGTGITCTIHCNHRLYARHIYPRNVLFLGRHVNGNAL